MTVWLGDHAAPGQRRRLPSPFGEQFGKSSRRSSDVRGLVGADELGGIGTQHRTAL
jgi:hypothetical protein